MYKAQMKFVQLLTRYCLPSRIQVHELPPDKLKIRDVVHIDIANDPIASADYKEDEDPAKFKSQKTGRGPLVGKDWMRNVQPVMTCYKLVTCEFKWFGLQTRVEGFIQKAERRLFTNFHRQVFCWIDRWYGLTMEDIRAIEDNTKEELDRVRESFNWLIASFLFPPLIAALGICLAANSTREYSWWSSLRTATTLTLFSVCLIAAKTSRRGTGYAR